MISPPPNWIGIRKLDKRNAGVIEQNECRRKRERFPTARAKIIGCDERHFRPKSFPALKKPSFVRLPTRIGRAPGKRGKNHEELFDSMKEVAIAHSDGQSVRNRTVFFLSEANQTGFLRDMPKSLAF
jgi:hypothetical protein